MILSTFSECVSLLSMEMVEESLEENIKVVNNGDNKDKKEENNNQVKIKKIIWIKFLYLIKFTWK